jgi:dihydrofolate reductase
MRRVRYSVAMSLDGYIAGPAGEADWIVMDPEIGSRFGEFVAQFDTLLVGRRAWEAMAGHGGGGGGPFAGFTILVASQTLGTRPAPKGVTILAGDLPETLAALRRQPGKDIWLFGGGGLFRSLLSLGLVDTVEVAIIPVLLGAGIPLLPSPAGTTTLSLTGHRVYPATGTVWLEYAVPPVSAARARRSTGRAPSGSAARPRSSRRARGRP